MADTIDNINNLDILNDIPDTLPEHFIFPIAETPGSAEELTLRAIDHYREFANKEDLYPYYRDLANTLAINLEEYYKLSNLDGDNIRGFLPHISEVAEFSESRDSNIMDVTTTGRIKSLYSFYYKLIGDIQDYVDRGEPLPEKPMIFDIYATRQVLHPRGNMRDVANKQAFLRETYKTIYDYMDYINELEKKDSRYHLIEISPESRYQIRIPQSHKYEDEHLTVPEKGFVDTMLEEKHIAHIYRDLATIDLTPEKIAEYAKDLQSINFDNKSSYRLNPLYISLVEQIQRKYTYQLIDKTEQELIKSFNSKEKKKYIDEDGNTLWDNYRRINNPKAFIDFCNLKKYKLSETDKINLENIAKANSSLENDDLNIRPLSTNERNILAEKINEIKQIDFNTFSENLEEARKIEKFSHCMKDYMTYPKKSGYQAVHVLVSTPYGNYESQWKTEEQEIYAESGPAGRKYYKEGETDDFNFLKVTKPLLFKRDEFGEIIRPVQIGVGDFETAVENFYGNPFPMYANGLTFSGFKKKYKNQADFYEALFKLGEGNGSHTRFKNLIDKFNSLFKPQEKEEISTSSNRLVPYKTVSDAEKVPEDIYAEKKYPDYDYR